MAANEAETPTLYNPARPRRAKAALRPFVNLTLQERKQLYARAVEIWDGNTTGATYLECGLKAAEEAFVSVTSLDHRLIKVQVYKRMSALGKLLKAAIQIEDKENNDY